MSRLTTTEPPKDGPEKEDDNGDKFSEEIGAAAVAEAGWCGCLLAPGCLSAVVLIVTGAVYFI